MQNKEIRQVRVKLVGQEENVNVDLKKISKELFGNKEAKNKNKKISIGNVRKYYEASEYLINEEGILCYKKDKKMIKLCNMVIIPVSQLIITDGIHEEKYLELTGVLNGNRKLPNVKVKLHDLRNSNWIENRWGIQCILYPISKCYEKILCAIKLACKDIETKSIYKTIGWSKIGGNYFYLHGRGAIGKESSVLVHESLNKFTLVVDERVNKNKVYKKSLQLLEIAPIDVTLPLFCFTILSTINTLLKLNNLETKFTLWLYGETGSRKTTLANLFFNIFNQQIAPEIPANFKDTKTALEIKMCEYKDCVLLVDDYHPTDKLSEKKDMEDKAEFILRMYGDRIKKSRSNINLTKQREFMTRGLCAITAEDAISIQSNMARCISVPLERNCVDLEKLTEFQRNPLIFPTAIYNFISWLTNYINREKGLPNLDLDWFREKYRNTDIHARLIDSVWSLKYAYYLYLSYGVNIGKLEVEEVGERLKIAETIFIRLIQKQHTEMKTENPVSMYLNTIEELITSNQMPLNKLRQESGSQKYGWYDDHYYYLIPEITYNKVLMFWERRNKVFPLTTKKLHDRLYQMGIIEIDESSKRKCPKITVEKGRRTRVLKINRKKLEEYTK
ncbi:hypothetical protein [Bacillus cereus group sp. TH150LC]|uniref:hypothetical protein n=1 Tax=Bacillus cereus group sp. TH150LC TaxID=3018061 RepID=UPI0022E4ACF6|nr:hypothetical protein [Bacillus cereus group sp. TH150LC]MDA1657009.1 hypothetical protein [Bacillus cereus group sp. TH150LC]